MNVIFLRQELMTAHILHITSKFIDLIYVRISDPIWVLDLTVSARFAFLILEQFYRRTKH